MDRSDYQQPSQISHTSSEKITSSETSPPSLPSQASPPASDGSLRGWLQCLGAFFLFFNSWGIVNTFGAYQTFYEQRLLHDESPSRISWIGSLQAFLFIFGGVLAGPLYDYGYLRGLICTGSFLIVFGMMMTSLASSYWEIILAQGLVVGLGNGCLFVPSIAVLPTYFTKWRALATGVAITGGNIGGIIYPIVFDRLQHLGFRWVTRILAFMMLATLSVPIAVMKMRIKPSTARRLIDLNVWSEPSFATFASASLFGSIGLYIPYFYVQTFSIEHEILPTGDLLTYLLPLLNAGSVFGRIILAYAADKCGPVNILIMTSLGSTVFTFIWIGIRNTAGLVVFCLFYGCFSGAFISLSLSVVAATLCPNLGVLGVRIGMICLPTAIGFLIGNPVAGAILKHSWTGLQAFCGGTIALATLGILVVRIMKAGKDIRVKC